MNSCVLPPKKHFCTFLYALLCVCSFLGQCSEQGNTVKKWANNLGHELYELGVLITNSEDLAKRYSQNNAVVSQKDPKALLAEIKENIERMVDRKVDAVKCILKVAEEVAETFEYNANETNYEYYNSKYSPIGDEEVDLPPSLENNRHTYMQMYLNNDTHFYNVPVNTSYSSVHVPLTIYDKHKDAQIAIHWSEALDEVFVQNYKSDPSLSWQYFGSTTGIMRHYPAMRWKGDEMDLFDCRIRTWYIEAATCTKDVIILVDSSGSMQGMRKHIANLTISNILDTFSNNDFLNVMNYSVATNYTVACFQEMLVQATKENLNTFKRAVNALDSDKKSNSSQALEAAFKLLEKYRTPERCGEDNSKCNQMIMLVTDGIAGNLSDIFEMYNRLNDSSIPVRIFTYLIGLEVTNVNEIMWAACTNRGYYSHVESLEEVTGSVFKYIPVIARPLVLQGIDHPVSWTHAYADTTYDDENDMVYNEPYRLLTSVAVPAFDRKVNNENGSVTADLLGVAATDVPIDELRKLTLPYKIGVMGYAFVISNNGYILMHPSFRPVFNKTRLKENYNSVDLLEVEQHDYTLAPRTIDPSTTVYQLREALVMGQEGTLNATLKYHFDNFRRIARQSYNFYYAPVNDTPFSIGIAIPHSYGALTIEIGDKIRAMEIQRRNITAILLNNFRGSNWRIHPKWVYCKYHYLEGHEFDTPEEELLHFIGRINSSKFLDHRQFVARAEHQHEKYKDLIVEDNDETECGRKTLGDDDYYCDKNLMHLLIFDSTVTQADYDDKWSFRKESDKLLFDRFNATLRFVATVSGLTRWEYIFGEDENNTKTEFGDWHSRAIDERWYKSAVLQHQHDIKSNHKSFVYSVPFDVGDQPDTLVTSSYAIFYKDGVKEAPASVVGFQFSHKQLYKRFKEITSDADPNTVPCSDLLDCYVVDNSGYILIAPDLNDTGKFFGEVEGSIMEAMLDELIFEKLVIYDFQGLCVRDPSDSSDVGRLQTPLALGMTLLNAFLANVIWVFMKTNLYQLWDENFVLAEDFTTLSSIFEVDDKNEEENNNDSDANGDSESVELEYYPCDLQRDLFLLNQSIFDKFNDPYQDEVPKGCSRPFFLKRIPNSNLILVAVNVSHSHCDRVYTTDPKDVEYAAGVEHPCQKIAMTTLPRRPLTGCYNQHEDEVYINTCGRTSRFRLNLILILGALIITVLLQVIRN